jgi:HEAT repeat protein
MTTNADLATGARQLAAAAPDGSLGRRAYGCAAVVLSTTGSLAAARRALADIADPEIRDAAAEVLGQLASREAPR